MARAPETFLNDELLIEKLMSASGLITKYKVSKSKKERIRIHSLFRNSIQLKDYNVEEEDGKSKNTECPSCNKSFDPNGVCFTCGLVSEDYMNVGQPLFRPKIEKFDYQRINHFKDRLVNAQTHENINIESDVIYEIREHCRKQGIHDLSGLTYEKLRRVLRQIKRVKYYEHIPLLLSIFTGKQLCVPRKIINELCNMFKKVQEPFERYKTVYRKSFLSYSYTFHKFFLILGYYDCLDYFPLLKDREKLYNQEKIFKKICEELNWKFIPSM
jgi:ribosomal protein L32